MKKKLLTLFILCLTALPLLSQVKHYPLDAAHSQIKFEGVLGDMMTVEGVFGNVWGDLMYDNNAPEELTTTVIIESGSLNTDNHWRDKHLTNEEFLDTAKYEAITFQSMRISEGQISGKLSMKGSTYEISAPYKKVIGPVGDPWGNERITFQGNFTFSRAAYALGPTEGFWGGNIADQAKVTFTLSFARRNMDRMSFLNQGEPKKIIDAFLNDGLEAGLVVLEASRNQNDRFTAQLVDGIAKKLRQYELPKAYLAVLKKNTEYFETKDWVWANYALGLKENGNDAEVKSIAAKTLEMNPLNSLAIELSR